MALRQHHDARHAASGMVPEVADRCHAKPALLREGEDCPCQRVLAAALEARGQPQGFEAARHFGADVTVNDSRDDPMGVIKDLTGRRGADVAIEAVGTSATFEMAVRLARPGGRIANIGVHGGAAVLHLEQQWARDITITTGQVDGSSTPTLMRLVATGQLDAAQFVTHRFDLNDFEKAYEVFANPAASAAIKVVLTRGEGDEG